MPIRFQALGPAQEHPIPQVEIVFPIIGKRIPKQDATKYEVRLKAEPWEPELKLALALDDYPPQVFSDPKQAIQLGQLLPANRELEPGAHRLYAAARASDGLLLRSGVAEARAAFAFVPFWVGPDPNQISAAAMKAFEAPVLVLLSPHGTFNGNAAADAVTVDFQVLGAALKSGGYSILLQVLAAGETHETTLHAVQPVRITALPSGDHLITLTLLDPSAKPLVSPYARQSVTITVNRDAPVK